MNKVTFQQSFRIPWIALGLGLLLVLNGCGKGKSSSQSMTSYSSGQGTDPKSELFNVPPEQMSHLQIFSVQPTRMERLLRFTGSVAYNGFHTTPVITQVSGPVVRIIATPGQKVRARQPLLYVSSPEYSQLRVSFLKARTASALADKNYQRARDLYQHHAIAERDLLQAESDHNQAQADLQASEQGLRVVGVPSPETVAKSTLTPEIPVLAPIAGEVVERSVAPGQVVQAGTTQCFTISDMRTVWVLANVYQNDLAFVHQGDLVTIQTDAYATSFPGKISYLGAALDPATHTLQARIDTDNPGERLKKDMYVTVIIQAGAITNALLVPDAAVLRDSENQPFVYAVVGQNQFGRRQVTLGESHNGKTEILSGLHAGESVVGDGSLFLQFQNSLQR
jgi:membrane fusion protein, heavy metal efflux system